MRRTLVVVLFAALIAGLALTTSCKKKPAGGGEKAGAGAEKVIGVSLLVTTHDFYKELQAGLEEEAKIKGFKLVIQSGEKDVNKQITQMNTFVSQKVAAIIVCPADSLSIGGGVDAANKAGIPVFTADIRASGNIVSHIASDNVLGGQRAGEYMAKLLKDRPEARIGIIDDPTASSVQERVKGFKEEIAKYPNMKIVSTLNGQGLRDKALTAATNMLQAEQNLDAVFAINDDSAMGALTAATEMKRDKLIIIGYDATPPAVEAICSGSALKADVVQFPREIGKMTIDAIANKLDGKPVAKEYPVSVGIVDKAELEKQGKCKK